MTRTVIFDLDGTLADTSADLIDAANACFKADGLPAILDYTKHAAVAFGGGRAMLMKGSELLEQGWDESDVRRHYPRLLEYYGENIDRHTTIYDGVEEALDELSARGWVLGVCTNKPSGLAETLLQKLNLRDRFASMIGADTLPVRKPDPKPLFAAIDGAGGDRARSVLIGDTITDAKTGENAEIPVVLVAFGPEGEAVERFDPAALLEHYSDLPDLLDAMIAK